MKNFIASLSAGLILVSCSGNGNREQRQPVEQAAPQSVQEQVYYINNAGNEAVGSVSLGEQLSIRTEAQTIIRICKSDDKCKYRSVDGINLYEIKYKERDFKLRSDAGELIWKVKMGDGKIKLADNEEMENAIEIKENNQMSSVKWGEEEIGSVDFGIGAVPVLVEGEGISLMISGPGKQLASGILIIPEIPMEQRLILFAEAVTR